MTIDRKFIDLEVTLSPDNPGPEMESYNAAVAAEQERALYPAIKGMLTREPTAEQQAAWRLAPGIEAGFLNFEGSPPDLVDAIAGKLLDKGEDVNLRARVLDLAAKWDALGKTDDRADKYAVAYRACAGELRAMAQGRPVTRAELFAPEDIRPKHRCAAPDRVPGDGFAYDSAVGKLTASEPEGSS